MGYARRRQMAHRRPSVRRHGRFRRTETLFATGSPPTGAPDRPETADLPPRPGAITFTFPLPARGPTAPSSCARSRASRHGVAVGRALADGRGRLELRTGRGRDRRSRSSAPGTSTKSMPPPGPTIRGRVTVPVLWDKSPGHHRQQRVGGNHPHVQLRLRRSRGGTLATTIPRPADEIEAVNARVYDTLNNGVYKSGFATRQDAYEEAVGPLFETLDWLEDRLSRSLMWPASASPKPISACSPPLSASIRCITDTSSATSGG
jgi:hypothetical protein